MIKKFHKKSIILASAALVLTGVVSVGSAMAYFTTYTTASGGVTMNMGFTQTIPEEDVDEEGKHVKITNTGEYDCFVRVKVFAEIDVDYKPGEGWKQNGDYWEYTKVLKGREAEEEKGESTSELLVTYTYPKPDEGEEPEPFDIVVIQECTPVLYDADGNAYADWTRVITEESQQ